MVAVTIYVILGFFILYVLYRGWKYYNRDAPVFVNREPKTVEVIDMSSRKFKKSYTQSFAKFSNEPNPTTYVSNPSLVRNDSFASVRSTQEPVRPEPDEYEK